MTFTPFYNKILFSPIKLDYIIQNDKEAAIEAGKVLAVGSEVTFVKEGDTVFFLAFGAEQTPELDGQSYWTVACDSRFVMGKIEHDV